MSMEVFFSYSWKDIPIAMRIYSDLVRNKILVWRDEFSAKPIKKYETEISDAVHRCQGVLLLDSPNSRNSQYVRDEWGVLTGSEDWKNGLKKIAICLVGNQKMTHEADELFYEQNKYKFIDFSNCSQLFDNDGSYLRAITELCNVFGVKFCSEYPDITEKDFEDELSQYKIKDITRKVLLREFGLIEYRLTNGIPHTLQRLEQFVKECELLQIICPSPMLQLGIEYLKSRDYTRAKDISNVYTQIYPDDSRGWRVFAWALFELNEFDKALYAYNKSILLMLLIKQDRLVIGKKTIRFNNKKCIDYLFVCRLNRAATLFSRGNQKQAIRVYEQTLEYEETKNHIQPEHYLCLIDACNDTKWKEKQIVWIEKGITHYPGDPGLLAAKARWLLYYGKPRDPLMYYEYLINKEIQDISVFEEYLSLLKILGDQYTFNKTCLKAFLLCPAKDSDFYNYGHILYMAGMAEEARKYYLKSNSSEPWYAEIWE